MASTGFGVSKTAIVGVALLCLFVLSEEAQGTEYIVGDKKGWNLYPEIYYWPEGKNFKAGDFLSKFMSNIIDCII